MIGERVREECWDYGLTWISEISSLTHSSTGSINDNIPLDVVTSDTPGISEYLDFDFYDAVWFKKNAGSSPYKPGAGWEYLIELED